MNASPFDEAATEVGVGVVGIMTAYGVGLGIALAKNYRDPYYFFEWPAHVKNPVFVAALYFAFRLVKGVVSFFG